MLAVVTVVEAVLILVVETAEERVIATLAIVLVFNVTGKIV